MKAYRLRGGQQLRAWHQAGRPISSRTASGGMDGRLGRMENQHMGGGTRALLPDDSGFTVEFTVAVQPLGGQFDRVRDAMRNVGVRES